MAVNSMNPNVDDSPDSIRAMRAAIRDAAVRAEYERAALRRLGEQLAVKIYSGEIKRGKSRSATLARGAKSRVPLNQKLQSGRNSRRAVTLPVTFRRGKPTEGS